MRYSHGKMGLPGDGIMRIPPSVQTPEPNRMSNFNATRGMRPSSEMLPAGQQGTPESTSSNLPSRSD